MKIILFILLFIFSNQLFGQEEHKEYVTIQTEKNELISGKLIKLDKDSIVIRNEKTGIISFSRSEVNRMIKGIITSFDKTNQGEPFYFPTALSNGKGNHHYKNYFLLGHNFNFGVTDALDLSVGFELFSPVFNSDGTPVLQLGAKYSIPVSDNFHIGFAGKGAFNSEGGLAFVQLPLTLGGKSHNLTLSPSLTVNSGFDGVVFFLGGVWSFVVTNNVRLVTDFIFADEFRMANIALEFSIKDEFTIIPGAIWSNEFSLIPSVAFTVPFGQWK